MNDRKPIGTKENPIGGWYGLKKGFRGHIGMYILPLMEALDLAKVEHYKRNNRMRAINGITSLINI